MNVRRDYADRMLAAVRITDARVAEVFANVPRENFVGLPPWTLFNPEDGSTRALDGADTTRCTTMSWSCSIARKASTTAAPRCTH